MDEKAVEAGYKFRQMDLRANQMIDAAVAYSLDGKYCDPSEKPERFAHGVAQIATTTLLKMIYEEDAEIRRLREERDLWKKMAEEGLNLRPIGTLLVPDTLPPSKHRSSQPLP